MQNFSLNVVTTLVQLIICTNTAHSVPTLIEASVRCGESLRLRF